MLSRITSKYKNYYYDKRLVLIIIYTIAVGLVLLYSASSYEAQIEFGDSTHYLKRQMAISIVGIIVMIVIGWINYHILENTIFAWASYFAPIFFSFFFFSSLGIEANGAKRWVGVGIATVQVCDVVKIGVIIFLANFLDKKINGKIERIKGVIPNILTVIKYIIVIAIPALVIILVTSDLSSAVIIVIIGGGMLLVAYPRPSYIVIPGVVGGSLMVGGAIMIASYRFTRVKVWLNPELYSDNEGFQVMQSLYALGSGGLFGKGLGNGVQKLGTIPESQNDMIFTVVCEELGIVGGIALLALFAVILWRLYIIARNAKDRFGCLLVAGVMFHIASQLLINIAVVTNSMPNTGVPLPFMSYGGTSILLLLVEVGIALSVSCRKKRTSD